MAVGDIDDDEDKYWEAKHVREMADIKRKHAERRAADQKKRDAALADTVREAVVQAGEHGMDPGSEQAIINIERVWRTFVDWAVEQGLCGAIRGPGVAVGEHEARPRPGYSPAGVLAAVVHISNGSGNAEATGDRRR